MKMAVDAVCGMNVEVTDETPMQHYDGTDYYFCCEGCKKQFGKNPEPYTSQKTKHHHGGHGHHH